MKIPYKRLQHENDRVQIKIEIQNIEFCCDTIEKHFGRLVHYAPDIDGEPFVGLAQTRDIHNAGEHCRFEYCPFCGTEMEYDFLGTFERVTKEVRVD